MFTGVHTPVFCISEIPEATLDYFLQCIEKVVEEKKRRFFGLDEMTLSDEVVFITSKDIATITIGATRPTKAFASPFLGESIEQVRDWFVDNIIPAENGYLATSFLVMDSRTVEDNTCLLVCVLDNKLQTVRCDFDEGHSQAVMLEFGCEGMRDRTRDLFMDTGEVMTREMYALAIKGRLYVEDGKLKIKE